MAHAVALGQFARQIGEFALEKRIPLKYDEIPPVMKNAILAVEDALETHIALAKTAGAEVRSGAAVRSVGQTAAGVRVETSEGSFEADQVIVSAGAWATRLIPNLPLRVTREVIAWFDPIEPALFEPTHFPVFLLENPHGQHYGFPTFGQPGVKIAKHHHRNEAVDPDAVNRTVSDADAAQLTAAVRRIYADGASVTTTYLLVGVWLLAATLSIGTRTFVSGK